MNPPANNRTEQIEIDASAKWPVLVFLASAMVWLILGGVLQLAANMQLYQPGFLADCAWFTHGRLAPAAQNALVYGWGMNAAFAFGLWLMARLSATTLRHGGWLFIAAKFWNLGVTLGVLGILGGYSTSFELLEMPRFVCFLLLAAYALVGVWAVTTFSIRNTENVYASQWYLFGAAFWFPWLYAIAQVMLFQAPVRGVLQPVVNAWYAHGLYNLWFVPMALAAAYYFLPKILGKPVSNYYLASLAFWWLSITSAFAGGSRLIGAPVPVWIPTLGIVANMLVVVGVVIVAINLFGTVSGRFAAARASLTLRFILISIVSFVLAAVMNLALSMRDFAAVVQFTLLDGLRDWLTFYACFSTAMFGAAYFLLPRLTGKEWRSAALIKLHLGATALGVILMVVGMTYAGWHQGRLLNDAAVPFAEITKAMSFWFAFRTGVLGLLLLGHVAFLLNFIWIACPLNSQGTAAATFRPPPELGLAKEGHA
ncbi:cbb3-type cytochrome c oxidase subunit I [Opitutus sp. GAS368]|uniref:cbb3-type cytochrome c oxidase subunit I n=1 Tax=Opitutus sp. GAS368 TaxID=1882749 RepID=UPI00087DB2C6|nr:cbb3-type cytochrome c oxidase subunit I [Opitutus sp. GAS368]SDS28076.1 cytochrome c oxidase cbb3-type subunit 1 [Opitutus sp. GAS368]